MCFPEGRCPRWRRRLFEDPGALHLSADRFIFNYIFLTSLGLLRVCQVNNGLDHLSGVQKHISGIETVGSFTQAGLEEAIWREKGGMEGPKTGLDLCLNDRRMRF